MGMGMNIEVTGLPPYTCPYCPATFGSQEELDTHIRTIHIRGIPEWLTKYWPVLVIGGIALGLTAFFGLKKKKGGK